MLTQSTTLLSSERRNQHTQMTTTPRSSCSSHVNIRPVQFLQLLRHLSPGETSVNFLLHLQERHKRVRLNAFVCTHSITGTILPAGVETHTWIVTSTYGDATREQTLHISIFHQERLIRVQSSFVNAFQIHASRHPRTGRKATSC